MNDHEVRRLEHLITRLENAVGLLSVYLLQNDVISYHQFDGVQTAKLDQTYLTEAMDEVHKAQEVEK